MADRMLLITWNEPARGLEARALEVFNEAMAIFGARQEDGRIESFEVALMDPSDLLSGYIAIRGTREQISALRADEEFRRNTIEAQMCVDGINHVEGSCNEGVARDLALYEESIAKVPQRA